MPKERNFRFLSMSSSPLELDISFPSDRHSGGFKRVNHSEKQITVTSCWAKPARAQKARPELPERALVEYERDLHPPRKRLQRFDWMNIFARSSNSLCEQTAPPRGDASEGRARKRRGPNVPRFSLDSEIKVRQSPGPHDSTPRIQRGYGEGQKRMSKRFSI